jgi:D-threo-aldose 1-dehydrogenase
MATLNAAPYGSGILAKGPDIYARYAYQAASPEIVAATRQIEAICARYNIPMAAAALQFSMLDPLVDVTIVGMSKPERIQETIDLATTEIPAQLWLDLESMPQFSLDPEIGRYDK